MNLHGIAGLKGIKQEGGTIVIGAMTTHHELLASDLVAAAIPILHETALLIADPQIRYRGTIGGNVSQDARCWYYRRGWHCYRAGGNICYADTPTAINREHAILQADRCVAVSPSDTAPALIALDAQMVIRSRGSERIVEAADYFLGPGTDITKMTVLQPGELLTAIRIPATSVGCAA